MAEEKLQYNPFKGFFTVFEDVNKKLELDQPLGKKDISSWAKDILYNDAGLPTIIVNSNIEDRATQQSPEIINDNNPEIPLITNTQQEEVTPTVKKITKQQQLSNGKKVISLLTKRLNLTQQQAAGIAGVIMSESGLNPGNFNREEKAGRLTTSKANGAGYGAGMLQWSMGRKANALQLLGKNSPIESLSLEDQVEIIARELEGPYKEALQGIRSSKTASQAAATMYCHNAAASSRSPYPATQVEIDTINKRYSKFGNPHLVNDGMNYAEQLLEYVTKQNN